MLAPHEGRISRVIDFGTLTLSARPKTDVLQKYLNVFGVKSSMKLLTQLRLQNKRTMSCLLRGHYIYFHAWLCYALIFFILFHQNLIIDHYNVNIQIGFALVTKFYSNCFIRFQLRQFSAMLLHIGVDSIFK